MATSPPAEHTSLWELAQAFLKLGTIAFGGPAAHIAMMEQEFVRRRNWLSEQEFLDRLAAANLIPGPSSTEMAIYIGFTRCGWPGLIVAGCCFILPAALMVGAIAAAYARYGSLPQVSGVLYGLKPVVIAIILQAFWKLARTAVKTNWLAAIGVLATVLCFLGTNELLILLSAGALAGFAAIFRKSSRLMTSSAPLFSFSRLSLKSLLAKIAINSDFVALTSGAALAAVPFSLTRLFLVFLKTGAVLFGSGYVLLAFLRADFVQNLHWLTEKQLLDAVAVGQITPGPVFTTATFVGYIVGGVPGAVLATIAIFLPGFFLVAVSGPLLPRIRQSAVASAFLDGVVMGSVALMAYVTWLLAKAALVDPLTLTLAIASAVLLLRFRLNPIWLMAAAAVAGYLHGP